MSLEIMTEDYIFNINKNFLFPITGIIGCYFNK